MSKPKTSRRAFRAGGGEYAADAGSFSELNDLRARFMRTAFECQPDLETEIRRLYDTDLRGRSGWLESEIRGNVAPPSSKAFALGRPLLERWGEHFGLRDEWCLDWAWAQKLSVWWAQERKQVGSVHSVWSGPAPIRAEPLRVEVLPWDITGSTRSTFEKQTREQFESNAINSKVPLVQLDTSKQKSDAILPTSDGSPAIRSAASVKTL
jgi:hypothetical protein